jgi:DNA-binding NarL/FixJ family response regulator
MTPTKLVIATSTALIQHGLSALVQDLSDVHVSSVVNDAEATLRALRDHAPDVLLVDDVLLVSVRAQSPRLSLPRVLLLSARAHPGTTLKALDSSACGFASERAHVRRLRASLRIISMCRSTFGGADCPRCPLRSSLKPPALPLTDREYMVFERIGNGDTTAKIADSLGLSVKTIETYRDHIKRKLSLTNATALKEAAMQWRWGEHIHSTRGADES